MKKKLRAALRLSADLDLPLDLVTQTIGILAKRRAGKSYLARRLVEQLHHAGQQVVVIDPKGDWWGILSSADGKGPGLPFVILGGDRGHVPLEATGGEVVAKLVVEERVSVVLDLSHFRKHEIATFNAVFLESLYRLKATDRYRTPCMLVIDEADAIAPQRPQPNEARMLGAAEDIVRRGGQRALGCIMITQRTAVLNKNVLTQVQVLIALRTISPQDLKAMNEWIDVHGTPDERKTLMASLPSLPVGDAWVWSPGWPEDAGIFQRIHTLPIETFDSGATPRAGETRLAPKRVADVDLNAVRKQMAATIERAKHDDPRELRKRIAELEAELRSARAARPKPERVEVPVLTDADRAAVTAVLQQCNAIADLGTGLRDALAKVSVGTSAPTAPPPPVHTPARAARAPAPVDAAPAVPAVAGNGKLGGGERKVLTVLAQYPGQRNRRQIAILSGYASGGGGFKNYLSALRTRGLITGRDAISITPAGLEELGPFERLPTGAALREYWLQQLGKAERSILSAVCEAYPEALTKDEVAAATGYDANGGGFKNALSRLRTLELVQGRGEIAAVAELF